LIGKGTIATDRKSVTPLALELALLAALVLNA